MDVADGPVAIGLFAVADVIVMGRDDHILLFQLGIAPLEAGREDCGCRRRNPGSNGPSGPAGFEMQLFQLHFEKRTGRPTAAASGFAAFERIVGQNIDKSAAAYRTEIDFNRRERVDFGRGSNCGGEQHDRAEQKFRRRTHSR